MHQLVLRIIKTIKGPFWRVLRFGPKENPAADINNNKDNKRAFHLGESLYFPVKKNLRVRAKENSPVFTKNNKNDKRTSHLRKSLDLDLRKLKQLISIKVKTK